MTIYDRAAASALRMLTKYGSSGTLRVVTVGEYDPNTGSAPTTENDYPVSVAKFDFDLRMSGTTFAPGTVIIGGDKQIFMAAQGLAVTPAPGNKIIIGSETWNVEGVKELKPAATPILYEILGRK